MLRPPPNRVKASPCGPELWTVPGDEDLRWCAANQESFLVPDGKGGVRVLGPGGEPRWTRSHLYAGHDDILHALPLS
ncbi:hypothetical protein ACWC9T_25500 [Kitasatospora sp. NPDC001159]